MTPELSERHHGSPQGRLNDVDPAEPVAAAGQHDVDEVPVDIRVSASPQSRSAAAKTGDSWYRRLAMPTNCEP